MGFLLLPATARTQQPPQSQPTVITARHRLRILGVFDEASGEPVEGAEVADLLTGAAASTTRTGTVSLFFLPEGGGLVRIRKVGYAATTLAVRISPDDTIPITVLLSKAVELPAVVTRDSAPHYTSPGLRGFEQRRGASSGGYFVAEADLRKADDRKLGEVLRSRVPGLVFIGGSGGANYLVSQRNCGSLGASSKQPCARPRCYVHVYQDGSLIDNGEVASIRTDFTRLDVNQFAGVEYYAGGASVPAQYSTTGADCGVLLLWSRER
ncbi:MAG: TonB-dependent receptor plug domain-containing protein [bacterium]